MRHHTCRFVVFYIIVTGVLRGDYGTFLEFCDDFWSGFDLGICCRRHVRSFKVLFHFPVSSVSFQKFTSLRHWFLFYSFNGSNSSLFTRKITISPPATPVQQLHIHVSYSTNVSAHFSQRKTEKKVDSKNFRVNRKKGFKFNSTLVTDFQVLE